MCTAGLNVVSEYNMSYYDIPQAQILNVNRHRAIVRRHLLYGCSVAPPTSIKTNLWVTRTQKHNE